MKKLAVGTPVWFVTPDRIRRTGEVARYRGSDAVVSVDSGAFYMVPPEELRLPEPERAPRVMRQEGRVVRADIRQLRDPSPLTGDDWSLSLGYSAGFGTPSEDDVLGWMAEEHPGWRVLDCTNGRPGWLKVVASASPTAADHSLIAEPVDVAWQMPVDRWKPGNEPGLMTPELGGGSGSGSPGGRFDIGAEAECDEDEDDEAKTGRLRITAADLRLGHNVDMPTVYGAHGPAVGHRRTAAKPEMGDVPEWLHQIVEMAADDNSDAYATKEVETAFDNYVTDLEQALLDFVGDAAIVQDMMDDSHPGSDDAPFLVYMTLVGHGAGIWDGRWDHYKQRGIDLDDLQKHLEKALAKHATEGQGGELEGAIYDAAYPFIESEDDDEDEDEPADEPKSEGDQLVDFFGGRGQWKTPEKHSWSARVSWYSPPSAADVAAYLQTLSVSDGVGAVEVTGVSDAGSSGTIQILDVDGTYSVGGSQFWDKLTRADERRDAIQNLVYRELTAAASAQGIQGAGLPDSKVVEVSGVRRVARKTAAAYEQMYGPLGSHFDDSVGTGHGEDASSGSYYRNADADPEEAQREEDGESIETIGLGLNVARKTDDPARVRVGVDKTTKTYWTEYYPETEDGKGYGELLVKNVKEDDADGDKDADFHKTAPPGRTEERREMVQAMFLDSFDRMPTFRERVACMLLYRRVDEWGSRFHKRADPLEEGAEADITGGEEQGVGSKIWEGAKGLAGGVGDFFKKRRMKDYGPDEVAALISGARSDPELQKTLDMVLLNQLRTWATQPGELEARLGQSVYQQVLRPAMASSEGVLDLAGYGKQMKKYLKSGPGQQQTQKYRRMLDKSRQGPSLDTGGPTGPGGGAPGGGGGAGGGAPSAPARAPEPTIEEIETDFFGAPAAPVSPPEAPVVAEEPTPEPAAVVEEEEVAAVELGHSAQQALTKLKKMAPEQRQEMVVVLENSIGNPSRWHDIPTVLGGLPAGSISPEEGQEIIDQLTADDEPPPSDPEGGAPPPSSDPESRPEESAVTVTEGDVPATEPELEEPAVEEQSTVTVTEADIPPSTAPAEPLRTRAAEPEYEWADQDLSGRSSEEAIGQIQGLIDQGTPEALKEAQALHNAQPDEGFSVNEYLDWADLGRSVDDQAIAKSFMEQGDRAGAAPYMQNSLTRLQYNRDADAEAVEEEGATGFLGLGKSDAQKRLDKSEALLADYQGYQEDLKQNLPGYAQQLDLEEKSNAASDALDAYGESDEFERNSPKHQELYDAYITPHDLSWAYDKMLHGEELVDSQGNPFELTEEDMAALEGFPGVAPPAAAAPAAPPEPAVDYSHLADDLVVEEDVGMGDRELEQDELQPEQELQEILDAPGAANRPNVPEIQDLAEEIAEAGSQEILEGTDVVRSTPEDIEAQRLEVAELQKIVDDNPRDDIEQYMDLMDAEQELADMEAAIQGGGGEPVSEPPASDELEESLVEEQLAVPTGESAIPTDKIPGRKEELPIPELVVDPAPVSQGDTPTDPMADRGKQRDQGSAPSVEEPPGMTSFLESQSQGEGGKWPSEVPMPDPYAQTDYAHAPEGQPVQLSEEAIQEALEDVVEEDAPLVTTTEDDEENVGSQTEVGPVKAMRRRAAEVGDRVVLPAGTPYYAHDAQRRKTTHYPNGSEMNIKLTLQDVRASGAWGMDAGNVFGTGKNYIWIPSTAFNDLITFEEESRRPSRYTWSDLPHKESNMKKESSAFANVWRALKVAILERNGADIVATITWDPDASVFADTKSTSMRQVLRTYLKGVSSHKEGRIGNLGFITRARFLDFDMDAGMAVMAFRSSVPVPVKPQVITIADKDL